MLADNPRAFLYEEAIRACAAEYHDTEGGDATVLDIGCGTGLLSILAAQTPHVSKVWGVDTNADAIKVATENAKRVLGSRNVGRGKKMEFVLTTPDACPPTIPKVHMLISEILGTLINSENAMKYVGMYMRKKLLTHSSGNVYVVPRICEQRMCLRSFSHVPDSLRVATSNAVDLAWRHRAWCPTTENGLSLLLHAFPCKRLTSTVARTEHYGTNPPSVGAGRPLLVEAGHGQSDDDLHLVVLEWVVTLWTGVVLENTVEELRRMSQKRPSSAIGRDSAWGFVVVPPIWGHAMTASFSGTKLEVTAAGSTASGPPQGDFRNDDEGSMLAPVRYAADFDYADMLVRGFLASVDVRGMTVVVYNDITSGNVTKLAYETFTPLGAMVYGLAYDTASYWNGRQAHPEFYASHVRIASRGWPEWLSKLPPPVCILAPSRIYDDRRTASGYPYNKFPTYPSAVAASKKNVSMILPDKVFNEGLDALKQAGTFSLMRARRPCVPYNLFPSMAYAVAEATHSAVVSDPTPPPSWLPLNYALVQPSGEMVAVQLKECDADITIPSSNWDSLRALARRNRVLKTAQGPIFIDQLNLVARATSNTVPFEFCSK